MLDQKCYDRMIEDFLEQTGIVKRDEGAFAKFTETETLEVLELVLEGHEYETYWDEFKEMVALLPKCSRAYLEKSKTTL